MMDQAAIVRAVRSATAEVFATMLGMEAVPGEAYTETSGPGPSAGIIGVIGLAGTWVGTAIVCCNASMACRISAHMLGSDFSEINEEVLDALSEITNMIVGSFKTEAEAYFGPLGLSIPTVVYGLNFSARTPGREKWVGVPFTCAGETVDVKVCLTPNRGLPRLTLAGSSSWAHR